MTSSALIAVQDLHKQYLDGEGKALHILRGASMYVQAGETVSIMGASGVGKSTLLHLLGTLDQPDQGTVTIDGVDLAGLTPDQSAHFRNETIGFVFQFHHLLMDFSALENVMIPMWIRAGRSYSAQAAAKDLLEQVGLGARASHKPAQLSGGEQQRLAIARALANQPRILLADEPTGNLDETTGNRVSGLLLELNQRLGLTMILVTHNPQFGAQMQRQLLLEGGLLHERAAAAGSA